MAEKEKKIKLVIEVKDDLSGFDNFEKEAKKQKKVTEQITKQYKRMGDEAEKTADKIKKSFSGVSANVKKNLSKISDNAKKVFKSVVNSVKSATQSIKGKFSKSLISLKNSLVEIGNKAKWAFALVVATTSLLGKSAIDAASEAEEAGSKFEAVFKDSSSSAEEAVKRIQMLGVGYYQVKQDLGDLGALMKGFGFSSIEATKQSEKALKLAYDLASYHNLTFSEAITKIRSGITGETEPLKQIGIIVLEENMKRYAETLGIVWKEADQLEKAQLRLNYAFEQAVAQGAVGDLARTSENFANQLRKAQGKVMEIKVALGEQLLPTATKIIKVFNSLDIAKFIKSDDFDRIKKLTVSFITLLGAIAAVGTAIQLLSNPIAQTTAAITGAVILWEADFLGIETIISGIKDLIFDAWKGLMKIVNIPKSNALKSLDEDIIKINNALKDGIIDAGEYYNVFDKKFVQRMQKLVKKGLMEMPNIEEYLQVDIQGNFMFDEKRVTALYEEIIKNYKKAKGELSEATITEMLFGKGNIIDKNVNEVKAGAKSVIEDQKQKLLNAIKEVKDKGLEFGENFGESILKQFDLMIDKITKIDEISSKGSLMPNVYGLDVGAATAEAIKSRKTYLKSDKYKYDGIGETAKGYDKEYKKFYKNLSNNLKEEDKLTKEENKKRKEQINNLSSIGNDLNKIGDMFGSDLISVLGTGITGFSSIMTDFDAFTAAGAGPLDKFAAGLGMLTTGIQIGATVLGMLGVGGLSSREIAEQKFAESVEKFGEYVDNLNLGESFDLLESLSKTVDISEISGLFTKQEISGVLSDSAATSYKYLTEIADLKAITELLNLRGLEFTQDQIKDLLNKNKEALGQVVGTAFDFDEEAIVQDINEIIANTNVQLTEKLKEGLGLTVSDFQSVMISSFEDGEFEKNLSMQIAEAFKQGIYQSTKYQDLYKELGDEIAKQVTNAVTGTEVDLSGAKELIKEIDAVGKESAEALEKINEELGITVSVVNDLFAAALTRSNTFEEFTKGFGESLYQEGMTAMEDLFRDAGLQKQMLDIVFDEAAFKTEMEAIKFDAGMTDDDKIKAYWDLKQSYEDEMNRILRQQGYDRTATDVTAGNTTTLGYANTGTASGTINYIENKLIVEGSVYGAGGEEALFEKFEDFVEEKSGDQG